MKKYIKLVNNERKNIVLCSAKACSANSIDICEVVTYDIGSCINDSYDHCGKDFEGCFQYSEDICATLDYKACYNGSDDYCSIDYAACSNYGYDKT